MTKKDRYVQPQTQFTGEDRFKKKMKKLYNDKTEEMMAYSLDVCCQNALSEGCSCYLAVSNIVSFL